LPANVPQVAKLGSGASGSVFKAVDVDTLQLVAVKLIHFNSRDMKSARLIRREVAALSSQSAPMLLQTFGAGMTPCPYISHFYGVKYDKTRMQASIAMEYACCGSLEAWSKDGLPVPEPWIAHIAYSVLQ
ncbi:kinase-like domain-containing protein, partial [Tribonema minus]